MSRPKKRRAKKRHIRAKRAPRARTYYSVDYGSELRRRGKEAFLKVADVAENDPEQFMTGLERVVRGAGQLYTFLQTNPGAKQVVRNALVSAVAKVAKRNLR